MKHDLCIIILTKNEGQHLERCLSSMKGIFADTIICDSGSSDQTLDIAARHDLPILKNTWINYSRQFNYALDQVRDKYEWVLRIDADEVLSKELIIEINKIVDNNNVDIHGYLIKRSMTFITDEINHGGLFPTFMLRLFRSCSGRCEERWMDEHIVVDGKTGTITNGLIIDDSKKNLTFWINKHNHYASREAVDFFVTELGLTEKITSASSGYLNALKRTLKNTVYSRVPLRLRSLLYFFYRYVFRLGFMDRKFGHDFHLLQGLWYRYLVDMKILEVRKYVHNNNCDLTTAINACLDIDIQEYYGDRFK